jgi:hypothetical protein
MDHTKAVGRGGVAVVLVLTTLLVGCLPRTFVRKHPDACDKGIRFYRPKPYLALRPHVDKNGTPVAGYVKIDLEYLPDFSEEYALHIRSGLGVNNTKVTLDQGWNLTSLNVELDSQTDENIEAIGALLGGVADVASTRAGKGNDGPEGFVVRASNVPLGYYEAVLGGPCGCKQLYGFRYVGFLPYSSCPLMACGTPQPYDCMAQQFELYGLMFDKHGVMRFELLPNIRTAESPAEGEALPDGGVRGGDSLPTTPGLLRQPD